MRVAGLGHLRETCFETRDIPTIDAGLVTWVTISFSFPPAANVPEYRRGAAVACRRTTRRGESHDVLVLVVPDVASRSRVAGVCARARAQILLTRPSSPESFAFSLSLSQCQCQGQRADAPVAVAAAATTIAQHTRATMLLMCPLIGSLCNVYTLKEKKRERVKVNYVRVAILTLHSYVLLGRLLFVYHLHISLTPIWFCRLHIYSVYLPMLAVLLP